MTTLVFKNKYWNSQRRLSNCTSSFFPQGSSAQVRNIPAFLTGVDTLLCCTGLVRWNGRSRLSALFVLNRPVSQVRTSLLTASHCGAGYLISVLTLTAGLLSYWPAMAFRYLLSSFRMKSAVFNEDRKMCPGSWLLYLILLVSPSPFSLVFPLLPCPSSGPLISLLQTPESSHTSPPGTRWGFSLPCLCLAHSWGLSSNLLPQYFIVLLLIVFNCILLDFVN